jgi:hypothetical protein
VLLPLRGISNPHTHYSKSTFVILRSSSKKVAEVTAAQALLMTKQIT